MLPRRHQIDEAFRALVGVQPLDQLRALRGDAPRASAALTGAAEVAAHGDQRRRADIAGVRPQSHGLDHVGRGTDAAACDQGHLIADALLPQPLVHGRQRQLNGDTHIVADPGRRSAGAAPEAVDGNDVRAAPRNAAGDSRDVVDRGHLDDHRFPVLRRFL